MNSRRLWWLGAIGVVAILIGTLVAIPVWAAPFRQAEGPEPDANTAMHEACEAGDVDDMAGAMDSLTDGEWEAMEEHMDDGDHEVMDTYMPGEDWQAMEEHMNDEGHHAGTGTHVMGMGGMMGGWSGASGGWSGMMSW